MLGRDTDPDFDPPIVLPTHAPPVVIHKEFGHTSLKIISILKLIKAVCAACNPTAREGYKS
jgi:hypothetical protein